MAVSKGLDDDIANADREAVLAAFHEDWTGFFGYPPDDWHAWSFQEITPDWFTQPGFSLWDDYEVLVSSDLAVIKGKRINMLPGPRPQNAFGTKVYKKEDGEWKLIHGHMSYGGP